MGGGPIFSPPGESETIPPFLLSEAAEAEQRRQTDEMRQAIADILASAYDKATAYTTVVIFGAYAAYFGIWAYTRDLMTPKVTYWVALLMGISILTFALFEVFKMLVTSREFMKMRGLLGRELSPKQFLDERKKLKNEGDKFIRHIVMPIWAGALLVSLVTGLAGATLLLWNFVASLPSS